MRGSMLTNISPREVAQGLQDKKIRLIDIRETDEFLRSSVAESESMPLSIISKLSIDTSDKTIVFTCQTSVRTAKNSQLLESLAKTSAYSMEGGLNAWDKEKLPLLKSCQGLSIFRQIQITAGLIIILSFVLSTMFSSAIWVALFVGVGLLWAGISGFCGMGILLEKMPWNKNDNCKIVD